MSISMLQARELKTELGSRMKNMTQDKLIGARPTQKKKGRGVSSRPHPDGPTPHTDVAPDGREDLRAVGE